MDSAVLIRLTRSLVVAFFLAGLVTFLPGLYTIQDAEMAGASQPLSHLTEAAMPATQRPFDGFCTDTTRIVQDCTFGGLPGVRALEQKVIADLIAIHKLPASPQPGPQDNASRLLSWERDTLRTLLYDRLAVLVDKTPAGRTAEEQAQINALVMLAGKQPNPRSADEQAIVDGLGELVRQRRLVAATEAKRFYTQWNNNPCMFSPPTGFSYTPPADCNIPNALSNIFRNPPSLEEFEAYGAYVAYQRFSTDAELRAAAANAAKAYGLLGSFAAAGLAAAATYSFIASTTLGNSIAFAITPFAANSVAAANAGLTGPAAAGFASAGAFAASVAIVVTAVAVGVIAGITIFTAAEIPGKLDEAITNARTAPNMWTLGASDSGKREIFAAYLLTTVPADNSPTLLGGLSGWSPVPAARPDDAKFLLNPGPAGQVSASLEYKGWDRTGRARLSQGWFIDETAPGGPALTLHLDYLNPDGERWTVWRVGNRFLHTIAGNVKPSIESDLFVYQNLNGVLSSAMVNAANGGPPTAAPTVVPAPNEAGWNTTAVTVVWNWRDNSGTGLDRSACLERSELLSGATLIITCKDRAGTTGSASVNVKIDMRPPDFNGPPTVSPAPNEAGWNNTDVTVTFECNDGDLPGAIVFEGTVSGVASCGPNRRLVTEGRDQYVTAQAEDVAGNTTVRRFGPFNIDRTPPRFVTTPTDQTILSTTPTGGPVPDLPATDNLDPAPVVTCMPAIGSALPLGSTRVTCSARDAAGNVSPAVSFTVTVVKAPATSASRGSDGSDGTDSPGAFHGGWWRRESMLRREHGYA